MCVCFKKLGEKKQQYLNKITVIKAPQRVPKD